jgi:SAM-dependent methyltransferase
MSLDTGYVKSEYTFGYFNELNPTRQRFILALNGIKTNKIRTACELGFGQGLSISIHATTSETKWHGNDFNSAQVNFANRITNLKAKLSDSSFAEYLEQDLPNFDYIGLHGIWTWVSDRDRECIVEFIRRKLNPGGIVYVSYNVLPGWSSIAPIRSLMRKYANEHTKKSDTIEEKMQAALDFAHSVINVESATLKELPKLEERFLKIKENRENSRYLAHELLNEDWRPMFFNEFEYFMANSGTQYAASCDFKTSVDECNFTPAQKEIVNGLSKSERESLRDFYHNAQFRKDLYIKGIPENSRLDRNYLDEFELVYTFKSDSEFDYKLATMVGEVELTKNIYEPVVAYASQNERFRVSDLLTALNQEGLNFQNYVQIVGLLVSANVLSVANPYGKDIKTRVLTKELNLRIIRENFADFKSNFLASPVIGEAILSSKFEQQFIYELLLNKDVKESNLVHNVTERFYGSGGRIISEGKQLNTKKDNFEEIERLFKRFNEESRSYFYRLGVLDEES